MNDTKMGSTRQRRARHLRAGCARVLLIGAVCVMAGTVHAETITRGAKSWSYATYQSKLAPLKKIYKGYPVGLNIRKEFWPLQLDRAQFKFHTWTIKSRDFPRLITYGSAINLDNDRDIEIMQCGWQAGQASGGYLAVVDFRNGKFAGFKRHKIEGCSNIWELKRKSGKPLIVVMGLDEGKPVASTAPTLIYDQGTRKLKRTGITTTSHESVVVDLDGDGNDDIVACNWGQPVDGAITFLRNTGATLQLRPLSPSAPCMALEVMDLEGNGEKSVLVTDLPPWAVDPALNVKPERNQVFKLHSDNTLSFVAQLPLPYFERKAFDGMAFQPGWEGNVGRSHDVQIARGDIDKDGREDAIMSSMIWGGDLDMAGFQVLRNKNGTLVDETHSRMFNQLFTRDATHNFLLKDVNGDGFLDIVAQGSAGSKFDENEVDPALVQANAIYINDGEGRFVNVMGYQFGRPEWSSPWIYSTYLGKPRWTRILREFNGQKDVVAIQMAEYSKKLSTGPNLSDPAERGAPGFNEFYYLLNNPDAAESVRTGADASGLDHYLRLGRAESRRAYAPGALVNGTKRFDGIASATGN